MFTTTIKQYSEQLDQDCAEILQHCQTNTMKEKELASKT